MNEEARKVLQDIIDRAYVFAKESTEKREHPLISEKTDFKNDFFFSICWDLSRELGLDLKGVIPE